MRVGGREPGPHQPGQGAQRDHEEGAGPHRWHHAGKNVIPYTTGQFSIVTFLYKANTILGISICSI